MSEQLPSIIEQIAQCGNCPLLGSNYVKGEGNPCGCNEQGVFIVGEAPGEQEDKEGRPFVGKSGGLLRLVLDEMKLDKEVYITNLVKRRPTTPEGRNRKPTRIECRRCGDHLVHELSKAKPKFVITLGSVPFENFYQRTGKAIPPITQVHGLSVQQQIFDHKYTLMPTYHPSYVLRQGGIHSRVGDAWLRDLEEFFGKILG